jgi:hypothetical protein
LESPPAVLLSFFGEVLAVKHPDRLLSPPAAQEWLAFGHSSRPAACRELGTRGRGIEGLKLLGTDQVADRAYVEWWIEKVAVPSGDGLADHAELLSNVNARRFVGDIRAPMMILAPTKSRMAPLDGQDSQRELQVRVNGSRRWGWSWNLQGQGRRMSESVTLNFWVLYDDE